MNLFNIILAFSLVLFAFSASAKAPPPGSGKSDVPANILLMLDTSGSMGLKTNQARLFEMPTGIAVDSKGNQYVVEERRHKVLKFDSSGALIKVFGGRRGHGNGQFYYPFHVAVGSDDSVYVSDYGNSRVQKFDENGNWKQNFGYVQRASGVGVDSDGNVYVGARYTGRVHKFNPAGRQLTSWYTAYAPYGISIYGDTVYVANMWRCGPLRRYTRSGTPKTFWNLNNSCYTASVEANANGVYVTNTFSHYIQKYSLTGTYQKTFGSYGSGSGEFKYVWDIASDNDGNIYATDWYNHRVNKFDKDGTYVSDLNGSGNSRLDDAKKVIKQIVSSSDLTKSANFGLMDWNTNARMQVNISSTGASEIYKKVDSLRAGGATYIANAMRLAKSYFNGPNTPIKYPCQKNVLIVISDGGFNGWGNNRPQYGYDVAKELYTGKNEIPTVVIGFHSGIQDTHKKLAEAGGTYTNDGNDSNDISPIVANSWQELHTAIADIIRQNIELRQTYTAPVILPGINTPDALFHSTFKYRNYSSKLGTCTSDGKKSVSCQWEGHLKKYELDADGMPTATPKWDAGKKLDLKSAANRKIWSMLKFMGADTTMNNFHVDNLIEIKMVIDEASGKLSTDDEITTLINFVRGLDAYDEDKDGSTSDERWKLAEIYHSELKTVGPPNDNIIDNSNYSNTEAYYRYKNNYDTFKGGKCGKQGCSHRKEVVYVGANDGMLHAFDSQTGEELWAFVPPNMVKNLPQLSSTKPNTTNSIFGVDGSVVVKDIFYDNKWRTVLLAGMGRGGLAYFALDVSNPNAPSFLFAFENDAMDERVYYWDGDGNRESLGYTHGILPEYDFSKLGEAWSAPIITLMSIKGKQKWVAVFGAGYSGGVNTSYGSAVYVIDLEDQGKVLKRIDLTDVSSNIANSQPAELVAITPDLTTIANYKGAMLYFADLESKQWKINLTDKGTLYEVTPVFNAEATQENDRMEFFRVVSTIDPDNALWNYYGTGNQQKVQRVSPDINNRIFGLKDKQFPAFQSVKGLGNTAVSSLKNTTKKNSACPTKSDLGWYVNLEKNERITGALAIKDGKVQAVRYLPNKADLCSPGKSYYTEHGYLCGNTLRRIYLGEGISTGVVNYKGKTYFGITGETSGDIKDDQGNVVGKLTGEGFGVLNTPEAQQGPGSGNIKHESWREVF